MPNPRVYFDVSIQGHSAGRIVMELFAGAFIAEHEDVLVRES